MERLKEECRRASSRKRIEEEEIKRKAVRVEVGNVNSIHVNVMRARAIHVNEHGLENDGDDAAYYFERVGNIV